MKAMGLPHSTGGVSFRSLSTINHWDQFWSFLIPPARRGHISRFLFAIFSVFRTGALDGAGAPGGGGSGSSRQNERTGLERTVLVMVDGDGVVWTV